MKILKFTFIVLFAFIGFSCNQNQKEALEWVNPFIGTGGHGHTYPGASMPFGLVQLSPDNGKGGWDWCSGYNIESDTIAGFSHLHLSGTGIGDLCDISMLPFVAKLNWNKKQNNRELARNHYSTFSHQNEEAHPGYYKVQLDNGVQVELTASKRVGVHRYVFPKSDYASVLIDLGFAINWDTPQDCYLAMDNSSTIVGYRYSKGWAADQKVFFAIKFKFPLGNFFLHKGENFIQGVDSENAKDLIGIANFSTQTIDTMIVKVGISMASIDGAIANIDFETPGWDFDQFAQEARDAWNEKLNKIEILKGGKPEIFYTALYHSLLAPNLISDTWGDYSFSNGKVSHADGFEMYSTFSLWDTYRAAHPLYTIIEPNKVSPFVASFMEHFNNTGRLPVWTLQNNETNCMIGYHSVPVILDAYRKGLTSINRDSILKAMVLSADRNGEGINFYKTYGYIPWELENQSVSKTLEYAYDDWCIAQMARLCGNDSIEQIFASRASSFKNVFDPKSGFMRGKDTLGNFKGDFNPLLSNHFKHEYTEGNAWQYLWYVPHDVNALIELLGGDKDFIKKLDLLFNTEEKVEGEKSSPDISGLIGQYAHGNEPSHHIAYLYNFAGAPWKTQERVHQITSTLYTDKPDGLCGNEDCGQMSAWYVLSSLGFYPVNPANGIYIIGTPSFADVKINLSDSLVFEIKANNLSEENFYIQSARLNGKELKRSYLFHDEIMNGGLLEFEMSGQPNKELWSNKNERP